MMNKERRKAIAGLVSQLTDLQGQLEVISSEISDVEGDEREYYDNMPESLKSGDKGDLADMAVGFLTDAQDALSNAVSAVGDAVNALEDASQ